jgi:hypothetical protein
MARERLIGAGQAKVDRKSRVKPARLGPYSRTLHRGAIGHSVDGRSREGRFLRAFEAQLAQHVGGKPSTAQRILISRLARTALRLELFDEKLTAGKLTDYDTKVYGALHNSFRLMMREIGVKPTLAAPIISLADALRAGSDRDDAA